MKIDQLILIAWVKRAKNRKSILQSIESPVMPSEIVMKIFGKTSNTYFNMVSRGLTELKEKGLVTVINPKEKTGRVYQLTKKGKEIQKYL